MRGTLLIFASVMLACSAYSNAIAQNASDSNRPPYDGADSEDGPRPIHIDYDCRILPNSAQILPRQKRRPYHDSIVCNLEGVKETAHWEERINGHQSQDWFVHVREREFVLQDVTDQPVMFVVEENVPKGWRIDSDPQPWQMRDETAYFHVYVKPGEIVRMHVGMREEFPRKPKPI